MKIKPTRSRDSQPRENIIDDSVAVEKDASVMTTVWMTKTSFRIPQPPVKLIKNNSRIIYVDASINHETSEDKIGDHLSANVNLPRGQETGAAKHPSGCEHHGLRAKVALTTKETSSVI